MSRNVVLQATLLLVLIVAVLVVPREASCDETARSRFDVGSKELSLWTEVGYFHPTRKDFRDLYGSNVTFGMALEGRLRGRFIWGMNLGLHKLSKEMTEINYWDFTVKPYVGFAIRETNHDRVYFGAGIGVSRRRLSLKYTLYSLDDEVMGVYELSHHEIRPVATALAARELALTKALALRLSVAYDYHFGGDPDIGDFGNTGGLYAVGGFGLRF